MPYKDTIKEIGLKDHLNRTAEHHNDFSYEDFVQMLDTAKHPSGKINKALIARAFCVDTRTISNWLKVHKQELKNV